MLMQVIKMWKCILNQEVNLIIEMPFKTDRFYKFLNIL